MEALATSLTVRRSERAVYRELADGRGGVLLDLDTGEYFGLNATGALVWDLLGTAPNFPEILEGVRVRCAEVPDDVEAELTAFLLRLRERGLVVFHDRPSATTGLG